MKYLIVFELDDSEMNLGLDEATNKTRLVRHHLNEGNLVLSEMSLEGVYDSENYEVAATDY